ncbi:hypothetical protein niasHS_014522 [Heterodera schachtii]|uniref:Secreted protein n=1 Tax=Heterodera schachtii TaxID=97005 RepID=A0ABD2ID16_HETSC
MPYVLNTNNAILCSLLHISASFTVSASHRRDLEAFSKGMPSLKWAANPRVFTTIDLTLAVPLAYAAYRVYKNGGDFCLCQHLFISCGHNVGVLQNRQCGRFLLCPLCPVDRMLFFVREFFTQQTNARQKGMMRSAQRKDSKN